jgi:beta-lactam-binding protein with PASTA domain
MVIVLALAFSLSAIVTIYTLFRSGNTEVPNVIGKPEAEAQKLAEQAGLRVKIQRRNDPAIAANSVIETRPGPKSSVKKDSVLTIVVSSGPVQTKSRLSAPNPRHPGERQKPPTIFVEPKGLVASLRELTE